MYHLLIGLILSCHLFGEKPTHKKLSINQSEAFKIYGHYIESNFKKPEEPYISIPTYNFIKPFAYGGYQGVKDGLVTIAKITGAAVLTQSITAGINYIFPSLFAPSPTFDTKNGQLSYSSPEMKLYAAGMGYFLKSWLPEYVTQYNPMSLNTMEQKDVLKIIPFNSVERRTEPIIHTSTENLIATLTNKLKRKEYSALPEHSGLHVFYGDSGTGKTEGVRSAAAMLYDSLPESIRDEVLFVECSMKHANVGIKNESAKNVAKLAEYYKNLLNTRNKGKKVRVIILISNEVKLQDRAAMKDDEESKKIIESYLELFDMYPHIAKEEDACILHFITTNASLKEFDKAIETRISDSIHFNTLSPDRFKAITLDSIKLSTNSRGVQLITENQANLFRLFTNLRTFSKVENQLWQSWGNGSIFSTNSPIVYPIQFNHIFSSALIKEYNKPEVQPSLSKNIKDGIQSEEFPCVFNNKTDNALTYQELTVRWNNREQTLADLSAITKELQRKTSNKAYQAAVQSYFEKTKNEKSDIKSFTQFLNDEYNPKMPRYVITKRAAIRLKNRFWRTTPFDLQDLRNGIQEHHKEIVALTAFRSEKLIDAYKLDNKSVKFEKVGDITRFSPTKHEKDRPPQQLLNLNQKIKDAAANKKQDINDTAKRAHISDVLSAPSRFAKDSIYNPKNMNNLIKPFSFERKFAEDDID